MPHINWNTYSIGNDEKKKSNQFPIPQICRLFPCFSFFLTSCHCQLNVDGGWYVTRLSSLTLRSRRALSFPPAGQQLVSNFRPPHFPIFCFFFYRPILTLIHHCFVCSGFDMLSLRDLRLVRMVEKLGTMYEKRAFSFIFFFLVGSAFDKSGVKIQWVSNVFACTDRR